MKEKIGKILLFYSFFFLHVGITLDEWMTQNAESCDIPNRALILQQIVNTLVVQFKGPNELCFWGSFQVWVDSRMHVYLYVDFNSSLAIQKVGLVNRQLKTVFI